MKLKISDKHSNKLRLKLVQPYPLDHNKKYLLGVEKAIFKEPLFLVENFSFKLVVNEDDTKFDTHSIEGLHTIKSFKYALRENMKDICYKTLSKEKSKNIPTDLDNVFKFNVHFLDEHQYLIHFSLPQYIALFPIEQGNFNDLFSFGVRNIFEGGRLYYSSKTPSIFNVSSVVEWHCDLTETSYSTHRDNPHHHHEGYLLHTTLRDKHFPGDFYIDEPNQIVYTPLKKNTSDINEIIIKTKNANDVPIVLQDVIVYLDLVEI